jgi:hypothetical protein
MMGCVTSDGPHESSPTSSDEPSDPLRVKLPVERSMFVTVWTGRVLENISGLVWIITFGPPPNFYSRHFPTIWLRSVASSSGLPYSTRVVPHLGQLSMYFI